jgi:hypothetical protein
MRTIRAVLLILAFNCAACAQQIHTVSGNFPRDLYGPVDLRDTRPTACAGGPCIWGHADYAVLPITFKPPAGYRVKILSLRGDVIAWIKSLPGDPAIPLESAAGVLGSFQTTSSLKHSDAGSGAEASTECDYCAADTPLYIQDSVTEKVPKTRAPYNYTGVDMLLDSDHVLHATVAEFLNTTGKPIHVEMTYTIQFVYVPKQ